MIAYGWIIHDVRRGAVQLALSTWLIWSGVNILIYAALLAQNIFSWQMSAYVFGTLIVTVLAFFRGTWQWSRLDTTVVLLAFVAMILWSLTSATVAVVMSLTAETVGSVPMWAAMWKDSKSQSEVPWVLFWIAAAFGLVAVDSWTWSEGMMPIWMMVLNNVTLALLVRGWVTRKTKVI